MKKSIVLLTFLLISCAPQVTVTSEVTVTSTPPPAETPIPTPTFHPQFIALQESIASSGERFTLQADGTIQDGAETIPGINVSSDGMISLTVGGETVTLDPADVNFDDENGISIEGYDWDGNEWVETMSEAMQEAMQHFADLGYPTDGVEFVEGEVTVTGRVDGVKVFEMNKKSGEVMFDQNYVIEQAGQQDLMPTDFEPRGDVLKAQGITAPDDPAKANTEYFGPLFKRLKVQFVEQFGFDPFGDTARSFVLLDGEINAWGTILEINDKDPSAPVYLYYEFADGSINIVPLIVPLQ